MIVPRENISTLIYVECDHMYQKKVCCQEIWCILPGLNIQLLIQNENPACKIARGCSKLLDMRYHTLFFLVDQYKLMA